MHRRTIGSGGRAGPAGFSLVELLVALVVLSVGLLGLVGAGTAIARLEGEAARDAFAARLAESRLELLRASRCTPPSGQRVDHGVTEQWSAGAASGAVRDIEASIQLPSRNARAPRVERYRSAAPC